MSRSATVSQLQTASLPATPLIPPPQTHFGRSVSETGGSPDPPLTPRSRRRFVHRSLTGQPYVGGGLDEAIVESPVADESEMITSPPKRWWRNRFRKT